MRKNVTVKTPSAGGGFVNVEIPEDYLKQYLQTQNIEYNPIQTYTVYDPTISNYAKSIKPENFADPINNPLNWGIFTILAGGSNEVAKKTTEKAVEYLPKLSFSSAYKTGTGLIAKPTMGAVTADAALGAITTVPAVINMTNNGVNFTNATEVGLGLLPVFGPAYQSASKGVQTTMDIINKPLRNLRIANELNKSVKNTKFINVPVYHTTTYTGNDLRPWSVNEWGLHVTPNIDTAKHIAANIPNSHIKEGTFIFTNNTIPIRITDQGSFQRGFGNFDYNGVEQYDFLQPRQAENMLARSKNPSYVYDNVFEKGGDSFVITNPEDVPFSKNTVVSEDIPLKVGLSNNILPAESKYVHSILPNRHAGYLGKIGNELIRLRPDKNYFYFRGKNFKFKDYNQYLKGLEKFHNEFIQRLPELSKNLYMNLNTAQSSPVPVPISDDINTLVKQRTRDLIDNFYKSDEYKDRFIKLISTDDPESLYSYLTNPNRQYYKFLNALEKLHNNYEVGIFNSPTSRGQYSHNPSRISLNVKSFMYDPNITIAHEFGHGIYSPWFKNSDDLSAIQSIIKHNDNLIGDASKHLLPEADIYDVKDINYFTNPNELRQRIIPAVEEMVENGWSVEEAYDKSKALKDAELKVVFNKDYIIKLLGGMLATIPFISNNTKNYNN